MTLRRASFFAAASLFMGCQNTTDLTFRASSSEDVASIQAVNTANNKTFAINLTEAQLVVGSLQVLDGDGAPLALLEAETTFDLLADGISANKIFEEQGFAVGDNTATLTLQNAAAGELQGSALHLEGVVTLTDNSTRGFVADIAAPAAALSVEPKCTAGGLSGTIDCSVTLRFAALLGALDFDVLAAEVVNDITINQLIDSANVSAAILTMQSNLGASLETPALE